jgi:hypothetical protein
LILHDFSKRSGFVYLIIILGVTQKGSGYSLQVLVSSEKTRLWAFRCYPSRGHS